MVSYLSDRSPIEGLSKINFTVVKGPEEDTRLPTAHTCFNTLVLPVYPNEQILESKLKLAILNSEGFGFR